MDLNYGTTKSRSHDKFGVKWKKKKRLNVEHHARRALPSICIDNWWVTQYNLDLRDSFYKNCQKTKIVSPDLAMLGHNPGYLTFKEVFMSKSRLGPKAYFLHWRKFVLIRGCFDQFWRFCFCLLLLHNQIEFWEQKISSTHYPRKQ